MHPTRPLARLLAVACLFLLQACTPALTEGVATAGDAAAKLWLAGRGVSTCSATPLPAPPALPPASEEPSVDQLIGAMAYGATLQRSADEVKASAAELQRIAAELLAEKVKAATATPDQPHHVPLPNTASPAPEGAAPPVSSSNTTTATAAPAPAVTP